MTRVLLLAVAVLRACVAQADVTCLAGGPTATGNGATPANAPVQPQHLFVDRDGSVLIASGKQNQIRRLEPGVMLGVVGTGAQGADGDGGPANLARITYPLSVVTTGGTLYLIDQGGSRGIRAVGPDGLLRTVATGHYGGLATDGTSLYATLPDANFGGPRVVRWALPCYPTCALATTLAGTGTQDFTGDGGQATAAALNYPRDVAVYGGVVYIADTNNQRVRTVTPDGVIRTVAGGGSVLGDGGPATAARLQYPSAIALAQDGTLYIADGQHRIRRVRQGVIDTVLGTGTAQDMQHWVTASDPLQQPVTAPTGVAVAGDGVVYVGSESDQVLYRLDLGPPPTVTAVAAATPADTPTAVATATVAGKVCGG